MARRENQLTIAVINYLRAHNIFCWRQNNAAIYDIKLKIFRKKNLKYDINGIPDVIGILPNGMFMGIELKTKKGKESDEQKKFEMNCKFNNGFYAVIKSIDDIEDYLIKIGIIIKRELQ